MSSALRALWKWLGGANGSAEKLTVFVMAGIGIAFVVYGALLADTESGEIYTQYDDCVVQGKKGVYSTKKVIHSARTTMIVLGSVLLGVSLLVPGMRFGGWLRRKIK